jgi:hypothetical protein
MGVTDRNWRHHSITRLFFFISDMLTYFRSSLSVHSYSKFFVGLLLPLWGNFWGVLDPLIQRSPLVSDVPERMHPCPSRVVWAISYACLCDGRFGRYAITRNSIGIKEKSTSIDMKHRKIHHVSSLSECAIRLEFVRSESLGTSEKYTQLGLFCWFFFAVTCTGQTAQPYA